jgi:hypothetical protein
MLEPPNVDHFADLLKAALDVTVADEALMRAIA